VRAFIEEYRYAPEFELRDTAEELYAEVGSIAVTLINEKIKRIGFAPGLSAVPGG
jgi:hypothetical protein